MGWVVKDPQWKVPLLLFFLKSFFEDLQYLQPDVVKNVLESIEVVSEDNIQLFEKSYFIEEEFFQDILSSDVTGIF